MPTELRHILFRPAEVLSAIGAYQRSLGRPAPWHDNAACAVELCEAGHLRVRIRFSDGARLGAPGHQAVFEGEALVAALIHHCRDRGIPLPARADKSLQRFGEQLCLVAASSPARPNPPPGGSARP